MKEPAEKMTPAEVEAKIESIARGLSEADAAQVRVLLHLYQRQETSVSIPKPMTQLEKIERAMPIFRSLGKGGCQLTYRRAFQTKKSAVTDPPKVKIDDMDLTGIKMPISLKQLYRMAPEVKRPGTPRGYPAHGSLDEKTAFVQEEYVRVLRARKQRELDADASADTETAPKL